MEGEVQRVELPYEVFGLGKYNVISLEGKSDCDSRAWFGPARYEVAWNRIPLHSLVLPLVHESYPITLPSHPCSKALSASL